LALQGALNEAKTDPKEEGGKGKGKGQAKSAPKAEKPEKVPVQQPQSYIMKLFDRSVNLAKFDETTPLYAIIRDWLKNAPRQKITNDSSATTEHQEYKEGDLASMPKVVLKSDIPRFERVVPQPDKKALDDLDLDNPEITREELLKQNKRKWSKIRTDWCDHSKKFREENFQENIKLIESLKKNL
jgi:hypothetical protein